MPGPLRWACVAVRPALPISYSLALSVSHFFFPYSCVSPSFTDSLGHLPAGWEVAPSSGVGLHVVGLVRGRSPSIMLWVNL
jgi:hypothetical protein